VIIKLLEPVQVGTGEPVTELNMREKIVSGDLRGMKVSDLADMPIDQILKVAGRLCAQPDTVMQKLCIADTLAVVEQATLFFVSGLPAGPTPSP
jgi:hypothetical protein